MQQKNQQQTSTRTGYIYQIQFLDGKVYIGSTITPVQQRIYNHMYQATTDKPYTPFSTEQRLYELPFIKPYRGYQGKKSSTLRLINENRNSSILKNLPAIEQRKWLKQELLKRTTVLETIELEADETGKVVDRTALFALEQKHINKAWIEDPTKLLNYDNLPFHKQMIQELFQALVEASNKSRIVKFHNGDFITRNTKEAKDLVTKESEVICNNLEFEELLEFAIDLDSVAKKTVINKELNRLKSSRSGLYQQTLIDINKRLTSLASLSKAERERLIKDNY